MLETTSPVLGAGQSVRIAATGTAAGSQTRILPRASSCGAVFVRNIMTSKEAARQRVVSRNGDLTASEFSGALAKILEKILENPTESKFRRLKARARIVEKTLLNAEGGLEAVSYTHLTLPTICSV